VVGINTMIVGRGSGIGFAVPSNIARRAAEQMLKTGRVERAWLGAGIQDITPDLASVMKVDTRAGALVNAITDGSPAHKAQLRPGDVIAAVASKPVRSGHELIREVINVDVGQTVLFEVLREGKRYGTSVTLVARPEVAPPPAPVQQQAAPQAGLGLGVRDATVQQAQQLGIARPLPFVSSVAAGSSADRAGLKPGDVIVEVDGRASATAVQVQEAAKDGELLLRLKRRDAFFYAGLKK